ncbi:hypothetical protein BKA60DRAFT_569470 [Fusarium oxysporum]|nr:hypothetical protein BKA60DRAFT_569470 [Fusarium oxysporum]
MISIANKQRLAVTVTIKPLLLRALLFWTESVCCFQHRMPTLSADDRTSAIRTVHSGELVRKRSPGFPTKDQD